MSRGGADVNPEEGGVVVHIRVVGQDRDADGGVFRRGGGVRLGHGSIIDCNKRGHKQEWSRMNV
jgi:hypothetical protein